VWGGVFLANASGKEKATYPRGPSVGRRSVGGKSPEGGCTSPEKQTRGPPSKLRKAPYFEPADAGGHSKWKSTEKGKEGGTLRVGAHSFILNCGWRDNIHKNNLDSHGKEIPKKLRRLK